MSDTRTNKTLTIRPIAATATRPLRSAILRPGYPIEDTVFVGDDTPETVHLGAFAGAQLVGIASLYREALPLEIVPMLQQSENVTDGSWRLRGMAVDAGVQRKGYGQALLKACVQHVRQQQGSLLWCNARSSALGFYRAAGFETYGNEFDIPTVGPHFVMARFINER